MTGAVVGLTTSEWIPPVDFVMEMAVSTSPAAIYAGTTWTQLKNCIIFAAGGSFRAGTSGGSTSVTLTTAHLPSHGHTISTGSAGSHTHTITGNSSSGSFDSSWIGIDCGATSVTTSSAGGHNHTLYIGSTGGGSSFSIMNPYYAANIWQRVG